MASPVGIHRTLGGGEVDFDIGINTSLCYICRTHRVPNYTWLFPSWPVSDFYSKSLIYHIQASGSP